MQYKPNMMQLSDLVKKVNDLEKRVLKLESSKKKTQTYQKPQQMSGGGGNSVYVDYMLFKNLEYDSNIPTLERSSIEKALKTQGFSIASSRNEADIVAYFVLMTGARLRGAYREKILNSIGDNENAFVIVGAFSFSTTAKVPSIGKLAVFGINAHNGGWHNGKAPTLRNVLVNQRICVTTGSLFGIV